ncbi:MAG: FkbM family methyltransferase [Geminicoccaceae bacterium]
MAHAKLRHRLHRFLAPARIVKDYYSYWQATRCGTFSQYGEDRLILAKYSRPGFYVDVGASHPYRLSNTFPFYLSGWTGITIEPIRVLARSHRRWRPRDVQINAGVGTADAQATFYELFPHVLSTFDSKVAHRYVQEGQAVLVDEYDVPVKPLNDLLTNKAPARFDLLSIDVEGRELDVLRSLDFGSFRPT